MKNPPIKLKQTITLSALSELNQICSPLFNNTQIGHFCYSKYYKKASNTGQLKISCLGTNAPWMNYVFSNGLYASPENLKQGRFLVSDLLPEAARFAKNEFSLHSFFAIAFDRGDHIEWFSFASKKEDITSFYFNYLDILYKFSAFFKETASTLINKADDNPLTYMTEKHSRIKIPTSAHFAREPLDKLLSLKQYRFDCGEQQLILTKKEAMCLALLIKGRSAKEIGKQFNISHRTVETHINAIKNKTRMHYKSELLDLVVKNNLAVTLDQLFHNCSVEN